MGTDGNALLDMQAYMPFHLSDEHAQSMSRSEQGMSASALQNTSATRYDVVAGSFRFPCDWVDARVSMMVSRACQTGKLHTLSVWRDALKEALEQASREAAHASEDASCLALFWERVGDEYHVSVTLRTQHTLSGVRH